MTLKEFREKTKDLPGDMVVCAVSQYGEEEYYEISDVESFPNEKYYDLEDEPRRGKILVI